MNDTLIVVGIVVVTVAAIAISFFRTKSTTSKLDAPESSIDTTIYEDLKELKADLESIKQTLRDQVKD